MTVAPSTNLPDIWSNRTSTDSRRWVDAAPFRAHLLQLLNQTGLPWRVIAVASRVPTLAVRSLLTDRPCRHRIRSIDAIALLRLSADRLQDARGQVVDAGRTASAVRALAATGFDAELLAGFLDVGSATVRQLLDNDRGWGTDSGSCSQLLEWRALAAAQAHGLDDADDQWEPGESITTLAA